jgi:hypothetical protein
MNTTRKHEMSTEFKLHQLRQRELERTARNERLARELRSANRRNRIPRKDGWRWLSKLAALFA